MRKLLIAVVLSMLLVVPVQAAEITAPAAPEGAAAYMPEDPMDFLSGFWKILGKALGAVRPDLKEAGKVCLGLIASVLLVSALRSSSEQIKQTANLTGTAAIAATLLLSVNSMIPLADNTIRDMCDYGKLLLPVMTSAMAAQGAGATSAALYAGTALFIGWISDLVSRILVPGVYLFLALSIASAAVGESVLKEIAGLLKWAASWCLKTVLTVFMTYMSITGVIGGSADGAAVKAMKAAVSTAVPVVGGILSNAAESVLAGAGLMKSAAGIYGIFAVLAIFLEPFLRIGSHYLMLKITGSVCSVFGCSELSDLIGDFSAGMGLLLAMTASVCVLLLFSTICFMKGVG